MMCRQVLPDSNGIEQIYIVKTEPGADGVNGPAPMVPEDVDQFKQEPSSDCDDVLEPKVLRKEQTFIKDEAVDKSEDDSNYNDCQGTDEEHSGESDFEIRSSKRKSLKRNLNQPLDCTENSKRTPSNQYAVHDVLEEQFACHCGMIYRKESLLILHKQICDVPEDMTESTCRFCQLTCAGYSDMMEHVKQLHGSGMPETGCIFCTERFKNPTLLVIHELRHQLPNVIKCDQCNRIFRQQSSLERHLKIHTKEVEIFPCDNCGKTFTQSTNLEIHKRIHSGTRPSLCDLCTKSFYCPSTLRAHRLTHFKATKFHVTDAGTFTIKTELK